MFIFRQKVNVELKCRVSTLQTGPLWRGFTMSLDQDFQGLERVSVLANFHFKEYCKSSNERPGRLLNSEDFRRGVYWRKAFKKGRCL